MRSTEILYILVTVKLDLGYAMAVINTPCSIKSGPLCFFATTFPNMDRFERKLYRSVC